MQSIRCDRRLVLATIVTLLSIALTSCSTTRPYSRGETRPAELAQPAPG
jgi:hypothetical protein